MPTERARAGSGPCAILTALFASILLVGPVYGEYGDIVINNHSDASGMRPAVFPHWFHRIRFTCNVCHSDLGFKLEAGGNDITMLKIIDGEYCGACHDGQIAWSVENCDLCHSALPGTTTQAHESTLQKLVAPVSTPLASEPQALPVGSTKPAEE
jgi:c(7)-type cytochrome triheme protein